MISREILFNLSSSRPTDLGLLAETIYPDKPVKLREKLLYTQMSYVKTILGWGINKCGRRGYLLSKNHSDLLSTVFGGKDTIPEDEISDVVGLFTPKNVRQVISWNH